MAQRKASGKKVTKGTMTEISLMVRPTKPTQLKPTGAPRRRTDFAEKLKGRRSNLTDQEVKLARQIWEAHVEPVSGEFISMVLTDFFAQYPDLTEVFLRLEEVDWRDHNRALKAGPSVWDYHMARIMGRLRDMMHNVDRPERLTKLMTRMGLLFAKLNIEPNRPVLKDFQDAVMDKIRIAMRGNMRSEEEAALRNCFELAFSIMEEASFTYYDLFIATQTLVKKGRE